MSRKHRILIIDDNRTIVEALKLFLSQKYEITTANNGLEGLKAIDQIENGIDLVITDLVMPELSGVVLISIVKKKYPTTPSHCNDRLGRPSGCVGKGSECRPAVAQAVRARIPRRLCYRVVVLTNNAPEITAFYQ